MPIVNKLSNMTISWIACVLVLARCQSYLVEFDNPIDVLVSVLCDITLSCIVLHLNMLHAKFQDYARRLYYQMSFT